MHCVRGGQIISIDVCELCTIQLPCNCYLKASDGLVPPLLDKCLEEYRLENKTVKWYPVNLLVLSQILNETEMSTCNGSVVFRKKLKVDL